MATISILPLCVWHLRCSPAVWCWFPIPADAPVSRKATSLTWAVRWRKFVAALPSWWAQKPSPAPLRTCGSAATYNPAKAIGAEKLVGSIEAGKVADFIICSPDYTQKRVFLAGNELK